MMNKKELLRVLEKLGMRPGRGLGQNFLIDNNLLDWIVRRNAPVEGEDVLEVGPGFGALTRKLLECGINVTAVEFDHRIAEYLRSELAVPNLHLIEADACHVDYAELFPAGRKFRSIANLPYSISTIFIAKMLELENAPVEMFFMLQKEMGERLAAEPGSKAYGALSVRCAFRYEVKIEKIVPPTVFYPAPEVESALVSFKLKKDASNDIALLRRATGIVKSLFLQRRKQMGKILASSYGKENVEAALEKVGLTWETRPDKVPYQKFIELAEALQSGQEKQ
ncbi:MAG: ribosomal RNA small subunit methyltransferase A [Lentisphaeria bacterium]|nr:ribosomal RNA small subunit methyltransferase A [Lentisphaeria bacterium]